MIALLKFLFQANNKISHLLNLSNAYLLIMQDEAQALCFVLQCPLPLFCLTMSIISFHFCYTICAQVPSNCSVITLRKTLCIFVFILFLLFEMSLSFFSGIFLWDLSQKLSFPEKPLSFLFHGKNTCRVLLKLSLH